MEYKSLKINLSVSKWNWWIGDDYNPDSDMYTKGFLRDKTTIFIYFIYLFFSFWLRTPKSWWKYLEIEADCSFVTLSQGEIRYELMAQDAFGHEQESSAGESSNEGRLDCNCQWNKLLGDISLGSKRGIQILLHLVYIFLVYKWLIGTRSFGVSPVDGLSWQPLHRARQIVVLSVWQRRWKSLLRDVSLSVQE